jgi:MFS family permease
MAQHLVGNQYSLISSSGYWAQLAFCCGFTAFLIVRVPTRILMSTCILCWGVAMIGLAFSKSFGPLLANRFLLGMFEAVNIPLFSESRSSSLSAKSRAVDPLQPLSP